jgi:D-3-phosphoglycerate dehydrogenase
MTWRALVSAPYMLNELEWVRRELRPFGVEAEGVVVRERLEESDLLCLVGEVDGFICGDDRFTARVFEAAAPRLKVVAKWGTGIDSIDVGAAQRFGVRVYNTPGAFTDPVADSVLGYVLAFARRIPWATASMQRGDWIKYPGRSLAECTIGIVGVGCIGSAVARRARAFGMTVMGNDIKRIPPSLVTETGMKVVSLDELLVESHFVSLNCDLNRTSYHLIGASQLTRMKPDAVLINTARGAVIDEPALVAALRAGDIAGAALDVFEDEPLPVDSPLRTMEHVLLAAHNANSSPRAWEAVHRNSIRYLLEGLGVSIRPGVLNLVEERRR